METKDLCSDNYKALIKEIEEDANGKIYHVTRLENQYC